MERGYALVTGGSSGIGESLVYLLAEAGWRPVVVSHREEENHRVVERVKSLYGVEARSFTLDLTEPDAAERLYAWCREEGIGVELLASNAGMLQFSLLNHTPAERIDRLVALHCTTPTQLCRLFGADMVKRGGGYILITASITAWTPYPTISHYAASKAYLKSFGQSLWYEMREHGVKVTTLFPSAVDTPLYNLDEKVRRRLRWWGVMLPPERVAKLALRALMRGRRRCLPGLLTRIEAVICRLLPAWALLPVLKIPSVRRILDKL